MEGERSGGVTAVWNETNNGVASTFSFGNNFTNNATTFTTLNTAHNFTGAAMTIDGTTPTLIPQATFSGTYTNNGTLTIATATITGNFINNTAFTSATLLTVNGGAVSLTNNGTLIATTALSGTGGVINGSAGILFIGGTSAITTLTATAVGNIVNYSGAATNCKKHSLLLSIPVGFRSENAHRCQHDRWRFHIIRNSHRHCSSWDDHRRQRKYWWRNNFHRRSIHSQYCRKLDERRNIYICRYNH